VRDQRDPATKLPGSHIPLINTGLKENSVFAVVLYNKKCIISPADIFNSSIFVENTL
jgi:hypothetical protein